MSSDETWFEVKIERDLAHLLQRIVNVYVRIGKARRADFLARLSSAIGEPAPESPGPETAAKESGR